MSSDTVQITRGCDITNSSTQHGLLWCLERNNQSKYFGKHALIYLWERVFQRLDSIIPHPCSFPSPSAMAIGLSEFKCTFRFLSRLDVAHRRRHCPADSSLALFLVAAIVTLVRLIVFRFVRQRQWWWDDFFALLGLVCLAVFVPGEWFFFFISELPAANGVDFAL